MNIPYFDIYLRRLGVGSFVDQSLSDLTTGRSDIWSDYLNLFISDWRIFLFGVGYSLENYNLRQAHSYFLELFIHLGIVGSIIYLNLLNAVFKPFTMNIRGRMLCLLPLAALLIRGFGINLLFRENFIFYLIICALVMADDKGASLNPYP
jgi:O-antigen ligase